VKVFKRVVSFTGIVDENGGKLKKMGEKFAFFPRNL
jgi:hypothetical protein